MPDMDKTLFTIGHSNHPVETFLGLLKKHGVTAVYDVRSKPSSAYNPQFNRDLLKKTLSAEGIRYIFSGSELGARSSDPSCYRDGKIRYERIAGTAQFLKGIEQLETAIVGQRVALMCAEKNPTECHRSILVSRTLEERGITVWHIHADGGLEGHQAMMSRLVDELKLPVGHMFFTQEELIADAYTMQEDRVAYVLPEIERRAAI